MLRQELKQSTFICCFKKRMQHMVLLFGDRHWKAVIQELWSGYCDLQVQHQLWNKLYLQKHNDMCRANMSSSWAKCPLICIGNCSLHKATSTFIFMKHVLVPENLWVATPTDLLIYLLILIRTHSYFLQIHHYTSSQTRRCHQGGVTKELAVGQAATAVKP